MTLKQVGLTVFALACAAVGFLGARVFEQSQAAKLRDIEAEQKASEIAALKQDAFVWASTIAEDQGGQVLRSFAAGLTPLLLAERTAAVEIAGASLLRLQGVQGVTILRANGQVLYASDAKLTVDEAGNDQTRWALSATDFVTRPAVQPGTIEMALPVNDAGKPLAVIWMAYDAQRIRDEHRPTSLSDSPSEVSTPETSAQPESAMPAEQPSAPSP